MHVSKLLGEGTVLTFVMLICRLFNSCGSVRWRAYPNRFLSGPLVSEQAPPAQAASQPQQPQGGPSEPLDRDMQNEGLLLMEQVTRYLDEVGLHSARERPHERRI